MISSPLTVFAISLVSIGIITSLTVAISTSSNNSKKKKKKQNTTTDIVDQTEEPTKVDVIFIPEFSQKTGLLIASKNFLYESSTEDIQDVINTTFINTYTGIRNNTKELLYLPFLPEYNNILKTFVQNHLVPDQNDINSVNSMINVFLTNFLTKTYEMNSKSKLFKIYYNIVYMYILLELNNFNVENLTLFPIMTEIIKFDLNISSKNKQKLKSYSIIIFFIILYSVNHIYKNPDDTNFLAILILQILIFSMIVKFTGKTTIGYTKTFDLIQLSNLSHLNKYSLENTLNMIHTLQLQIKVLFITSNILLMLLSIFLLIYTLFKNN